MDVNGDLELRVRRMEMRGLVVAIEDGDSDAEKATDDGMSGLLARGRSRDSAHNALQRQRSIISSAVTGIPASAGDSALLGIW